MRKIKLLMPMLAITSVALPLASCSKKKEEEVITFKVSFEVDGGIPMTPIEVEKDSLLPETAIPSKPTWSFDGWFTDKEKTIAFDMKNPIVSDLTLYAKWTMKRDGEKLDSEAEWKAAINEILTYGNDRSFKAQQMYIDYDQNLEISIYSCYGKQCRIEDEDSNIIYELLDENTPGFLWNAKREQEETKCWVQDCYKQDQNKFTNLDSIRKLKNNVLNNFSKFTYDTSKKVYKYTNEDDTYSLKFIDKKLKTFSWEENTSMGSETYDVSFDLFGSTTIDIPTLENKYYGDDTSTPNYVHTPEHSVEANKMYFYYFTMPSKYDASKDLKAALIKDGIIQAISTADLKIYANGTQITDAQVTDNIIAFTTKPVAGDILLFEVKQTTAMTGCSFYLTYNMLA